MSRDLYQEITDHIIEALESGQADPKGWSKPWVTSAALPRNASTRNDYRGINVLQLWITGVTRGYSSSRWATYRQWKALGATVRRGEKGTPVIFYRPLEIKDEDGEVEKTIPLLRHSTVFNAEQVDGDPRTDEDQAPEMPNGVTREQIADEVIKATGATINYQGDSAHYSPMTGEVTLPLPEAFHSTEGFYSTAFHELGHWTGHEDRLDRDLRNRFGSDAYAAEELVAELTAMFVLGALGIEAEPRPDHAHYIANWITVLREDKKAIFTASSKAAQAADFIRKVERVVPDKPERAKAAA